MAKKWRILIVEDHPVTSLGLRQIVEDEGDLEVCAEAQDAGAGAQAYQEHKPDLMLADIALPRRNGLELLKQIKVMDPQARVLFVSMFDEKVYAERVLRAGALGYLMKDEAPDVLVRAIRTVLNDEVFVSSNVSEQIVAAFSGGKSGSSPVDRLTDRELQVFGLIGRGVGNKEIADQLELSGRTIEAHRANIRTKMGLKDGNVLIREAVRWVESMN